MLESLMDAYDNARNNARIEGIKKVPVLKIKNTIFNLMTITLIIWIIFVIIFYILRKGNVIIYSIFIFIPLLIIFYTIIKIINRKNYNITAEQYFSSLKILESVLKSKPFNIHKKLQIKQLIRKYNLSIKEIQEKNKIKEKQFIVFHSTYIFPILAFIVGTLNNIYSDADLFSIAIVAILFIYFLKIAIQGLKEVANSINGNILEREIEFSHMLQDLLDMKYKITEDDLI